MRIAAIIFLRLLRLWLWLLWVLLMLGRWLDIFMREHHAVCVLIYLNNNLYDKARATGFSGLQQFQTFTANHLHGCMQFAKEGLNQSQLMNMSNTASRSCASAVKRTFDTMRLEADETQRNNVL
jgi:hypothetical protein